MTIHKNEQGEKTLISYSHVVLCIFVATQNSKGISSSQDKELYVLSDEGYETTT